MISLSAMFSLPFYSAITQALAADEENDQIGHLLNNTIENLFRSGVIENHDYRR